MEIPCKSKNRTIFPGTDRIKSCELASDALMGGVCFGAGTIIGFHEDGYLWRCLLSRDTIVGPIPCKGQTEVEFYRNGQPSFCTLSKDIMLGQVPCRAGAFTFFHENGLVFRTETYEGMSVEGIRIRWGTEGCFFPSGRLSSFDTGDNAITVNGLKLCAHRRVWLNEEGGIMAGVPAENCIIQEIPCLAAHTVWFHRNRALAGATLSSNKEIQGLLLRAESIALFHDNGKLWQAELDEDSRVQGRFLCAGERVIFDRNGILSLLEEL